MFLYQWLTVLPTKFSVKDSKSLAFWIIRDVNEWHYGITSHMIQNSEWAIFPICPEPLFRSEAAKCETIDMKMKFVFTHINHLHISHNALYLPPKILHKHCFHFLFSCHVLKAEGVFGTRNSYSWCLRKRISLVSDGLQRLRERVATKNTSTSIRDFSWPVWPYPFILTHSRNSRWCETLQNFPSR